MTATKLNYRMDKMAFLANIVWLLCLFNFVSSVGFGFDMQTEPEHKLYKVTNVLFSFTAGVVGGHIPGAKNISYRTLFEEDGSFKPPSELKAGTVLSA